MQRILVIEDDTDINRLLCRILAKAGYETTAAYSGTEAQLRLERETPDMIMLDLMLPGISGEEIIKMARTEMGLQIPILVLSARTALKNKVETITLGADDYITKPFEPEEMTARVEAALRRRGHHEEKSGAKVYFYKELRLYPEGRKVLVLDTPLSLTAYEYEILFLLIRNPEKVYSRELLYEQIWKGGYYGENNTVNVHVSNLRRKIKEAGAGDEYIRTVYGIGFKLE